LGQRAARLRRRGLEAEDPNDGTPLCASVALANDQTWRLMISSTAEVSSSAVAFSK